MKTYTTPVAILLLAAFGAQTVFAQAAGAALDEARRAAKELNAKGKPKSKPKADAEGWISIFDGKTLEGWKVNENPKSFRVEDGAILANGQPRSHLFYTGDSKPFVNFELSLEVLTGKGANGGVYFHTAFQRSGWPKNGFEVQVNNTHKDPKKTGSLYGVKDIMKAPAKDSTWFTIHLIVNGRTITVKVDGKTVNEYTEPEGQKPGKNFTRKLDKGTFALQAHDPGSTVLFRKIKVKRLPD